ncbi:MAG: tRNA pseudouridine(55) synthase TruB [bacterium]
MHGLLILNKPKGMTSFSAVNAIHMLTRTKAGHAGTLDPMAEGVLVVLLGKFTKKAKEFESSIKEYETEMTFGIETDSLDSTGRITSRKEPHVTEQKLRDVMCQFVGEIEQVPPMYSAIHHKGKRLYELARKGIEVDRAPRKITIHKLELRSLEGEKASFVVSCSKGTYIRTLCADIGSKLGCGAHMSKLTRVRSGDFSIDNALTLEQVFKLHNRGLLEGKIAS